MKCLAFTFALCVVCVCFSEMWPALDPQKTGRITRDTYIAGRSACKLEYSWREFCRRAAGVGAGDVADEKTAQSQAPASVDLFAVISKLTYPRSPSDALIARVRAKLSAPPQPASGSGSSSSSNSGSSSGAGNSGSASASGDSKADPVAEANAKALRRLGAERDPVAASPFAWLFRGTVTGLTHLSGRCVGLLLASNVKSDPVAAAAAAAAAASVPAPSSSSNAPLSFATSTSSSSSGFSVGSNSGSGSSGFSFANSTSSSGSGFSFAAPPSSANPAPWQSVPSAAPSGFAGAFAPSGGSLFSGSTSTSGGLFGSSTTSSGSSLFGGSTSTSGGFSSTNSVFGSAANAAGSSGVLTFALPPTRPIVQSTSLFDRLTDRLATDEGKQAVARFAFAAPPSAAAVMSEAALSAAAQSVTFNADQKKARDLKLKELLKTTLFVGGTEGALYTPKVAELLRQVDMKTPVEAASNMVLHFWLCPSMNPLR